MRRRWSTWGICFGLKHVFADAVRCYFAEPCASPAMLVRLASAQGPRSVYAIGLDNITEADGLAVGAASELVYQLVHGLVAGVYTVDDDDLFRVLVRLKELKGIAIEPSAAAAFLGAGLLDAACARGELPPALAGRAATQIFWTTGGALLPAAEYARFHRRGRQLLAKPGATPAPALKRSAPTTPAARQWAALDPPTNHINLFGISRTNWS